MRSRRIASASIVLVLVGATWAGCKSSPSGSGGGGDDAGDASSDIGTQVDSGEGCNPCFTMCPCTPGNTYFSPATCMTITCGASGMWGGSCIGPGCQDAAEEGDAAPMPDAAREGGLDAGRDAPADVASDVTTDVAAEVGPDAATEAGAEASTD